MNFVKYLPPPLSISLALAAGWGGWKHSAQPLGPLLLRLIQRPASNTSPPPPSLQPPHHGMTLSTASKESRECQVKQPSRSSQSHLKLMRRAPSATFLTAASPLPGQFAGPPRASSVDPSRFASRGGPPQRSAPHGPSRADAPANSMAVMDSFQRPPPQNLRNVGRLKSIAMGDGRSAASDIERCVAACCAADPPKGFKSACRTSRRWRSSLRLATMRTRTWTRRSAGSTRSCRTRCTTSQVTSDAAAADAAQTWSAFCSSATT